MLLITIIIVIVTVSVKKASDTRACTLALTKTGREIAQLSIWLERKKCKVQQRTIFGSV